MHTHPSIYAAAMAACTLLSACGGTGSEDSDTGMGSASSGGGTSASCQYNKIITDTQRKRAYACGIQVSSSFAQVDSAYDSVIAACKVGEKAKADAYYNTTYQKMVSYALDVSKQLGCG